MNKQTKSLLVFICVIINYFCVITIVDYYLTRPNNYKTEFDEKVMGILGIVSIVILSMQTFIIAFILIKKKLNKNKVNSVESGKNSI